MTMLMQQKGNTEDTALTRTDLMRLLDDAAHPEQLDVSSQDLGGINLMNCNLEGAKRQADTLRDLRSVSPA